MLGEFSLFEYNLQSAATIFSVLRSLYCIFYVQACFLGTMKAGNMAVQNLDHVESFPNGLLILLYQKLTGS